MMNDDNEATSVSELHRQSWHLLELSRQAEVDGDMGKSLRLYRLSLTKQIESLDHEIERYEVWKASSQA